MSIRKKSQVEKQGPANRAGKKRSARGATVPESKGAVGACAAPRLNEIGYLNDRVRIAHPFRQRIVIRTPSDSKLDKVGISDLTEDEHASLKWVVRLIEDPGYAPSEIDRQDATWTLLPETLASMPYEFRQQALSKYAEGIRVFGKVPVSNRSASGVSSADSEATPVLVTGPARPMACPEPPPEGSEFILAWRDGEVWNWDLYPHQTDWDSVGPGRLQPRLETEVAKYTDFLKRIEQAGDTRASQDASNILRLLRSTPVERSVSGKRLSDYLANPGVMTADAKVGFYAGVLFARHILFRKAVGQHEKEIIEKKSLWPDILAHAFERHGWNLDNKSLLEVFRAKQEGPPNDSKLYSNPPANHKLTFEGWPYAPETTLGGLRKSIKYVKKHRSEPGDSSRSNLNYLRSEITRKVPGKAYQSNKTKNS